MYLVCYGEKNENAELARSIGERLGDHQTTCKVKDKNSAFLKHIEKKQWVERQVVGLKMVLSCGNNRMLKQETEAILIKELSQELNIKE